MAGETELDRMVVRLRGDGSNYQKMLKKSAGLTQHFMTNIDARMKAHEDKFRTGQERIRIALSKTNAALGRAVVRMKAYSASIKTAGIGVMKFGGRVRTLGKSLALKATLPIVGIGFVAVRAFAKFDKAMTESLAIMTATGDETKRMRELALNLGSKGVKGPAELAEALK